MHANLIHTVKVIASCAHRPLPSASETALERSLPISTPVPMVLSVTSASDDSFSLRLNPFTKELVLFGGIDWMEDLRKSSTFPDEKCINLHDEELNGDRCVACSSRPQNME